MIGRDYGLVIDEADPAQRAWRDQKVAERETRVRGLWRWLLSAQEGREWVSDVLLLALGDKHHLGGGTVEDLYGEVALHNLACAWLGKYIVTHRDLYVQLQTEALNREDADRRQLETKRAEWARRRQDDEQGVPRDDD